MASKHSSEIPSHDLKHKIVAIYFTEKRTYRIGIDQLLPELRVNESVIRVN